MGANPIGFHKLCQPYVLISIQHSPIEGERGIFSQPTLLNVVIVLRTIFIEGYFRYPARLFSMWDIVD